MINTARLKRTLILLALAIAMGASIATARESAINQAARPAAASQRFAANTLSREEQAMLDRANNNAGPAVTTLVNDYQTAFGPIPQSAGATLDARLNYINQYMLCWGAPSLTLAKLRASTTPRQLLPNMPVTGIAVLYAHRRYLNATGSVTALLDKMAAQDSHCR